MNFSDIQTAALGVAIGCLLYARRMKKYTFLASMIGVMLYRGGASSAKVYVDNVRSNSLN